MARDAERRAAQRRLAKEIRSGTFKPSDIGAKARRAARERKPQILVDVQDLKRQEFGDRIKWNEGRANKYVQVSPETGKDRTIAELLHVKSAIQAWISLQRPDDWFGLADITGGELESSLYYH